jgi:hypothetical protein
MTAATNKDFTIGSLSASTAYTVCLLAEATSNNLQSAVSCLDLTTSAAGSVPAVTSVSVPSNGSYHAGNNLDFTVNWDASVTVTGTPRIALTLNTGGTVYADYVSGSPGTTSLFRYTVQSGDADPDGVTVGALTLNGGTIRDGSSTDATLTLNSVGSTASVLVDTTAPTLPAANIVVNNQADPHKIVLTFSENLDSSTLGSASGWTATANGGSPSYSIASVGLSSNKIVTLTLAAIDVTNTATSITDAAANAHLKITPPATLKDVAGNTYAAGQVTESGATHTLDSTAPTLSSVATSSPSSSGGTLAATASEKAKGYWIAVATGATAPTVAQVKAGANYGAVTVVAAGSGALPSGSAGSMTLSGLAASTSYDIHAMAEDAAGNATAAISSTTLATTAADSGSGSSSNTVTLPTGGGTATPSAGQTVVVTSNSSGATINLPAPTSTGTSNTVNVSLPGTGTVTVGSNTASTQLGVTTVTLPGSSSPVSTVTVTQGSATLTATSSGQPVAGLSNGIVVVSGTSNSQVTVTNNSGSSPTIGLSNTDTIIVPQGNPNVAGTVVNLPSPTGTGGTGTPVTVQTGSQSTVVQSTGTGSSISFATINVGGTTTPVVSVGSGSATVSASGNGQPLVAVGGGNTIISAGGGLGGTSNRCNVVTEVTNSSSRDIVQVNTCYIIVGSGGTLRPGSFHTRDSLTSYQVWAGETLKFDKSGGITDAYLGTENGTGTGAGDNLASGIVAVASTSQTSPQLGIDAFVPRLDATAERLTGDNLGERIFSVLHQNLGATTPDLPTQDAEGLVSFEFAGSRYTLLPVKRISISPARADGVTSNSAGNLEVTTGGLVTTFAPSVSGLAAFSSQLAQTLPGATSRLRESGGWTVTSADGTLFAGRPLWVQSSDAATPAGISFATDNELRYTHAGMTQRVVPDFQDQATVLATIWTVTTNAGASLLPNQDSSFTLTIGDHTYTVTPQWQVLTATAVADKPAWWSEGDVIYVKNADGTAQGFTLQ